MYKKFILVITIITICLKVTAQQNVGIGTFTPHASALLDVSSTTKGILIPRMTTAQRIVLAIPATGLMVYDTDSSSFAYYNGTNWLFVKGKTNNANDWSITGNSGTADSTNFIGTTDNVPFNIRVNNHKAGRIEKDGNVYLGYDAGRISFGGVYNTGIGSNVLYLNTEGGYNTAIGYYSLFGNTTGYFNTACGMEALKFNSSGDNNTAMGYAALSSGGGYDNTATGSGALFSNTAGYHNTANGMEALYSNTSGGNNTGIGFWALYDNSTGMNNCAIGMRALISNISGNFNTASGMDALSSSSGNSNTALGYNSGNNITTGSNNIVIGHTAQVPTGTADNQVRIGNTAITYAGVQVAWTITSDKRWKSDIQPSDLGLDFISKLKPVSYTRNNDESKKREYGFIAQELEQTLNAAGVANNGMISKDDNGMYGVRYNDLISPIVKAIQEQQVIIETQNKKLNDLQKQIDELKKMSKENK